MQLITLNISRCVHCEYSSYYEDDCILCEKYDKTVTINDTCKDFKTANWIKKELKETLCFKNNEIGSLEQIKEMENAISKQK